MTIWKTPKGTELQIINLRGKDYLQVQWRLVWFREERPTWAIECEPVQITETSAFFKATIRDEQGRVIATSHKYEDKQGFPDFREKAETGAVGRALAMIGYGTQFCADELDEGERLADAPVAKYVDDREGNGIVGDIKYKSNGLNKEKTVKKSDLSLDKDRTKIQTEMMAVYRKYHAATGKQLTPLFGRFNAKAIPELSAEQMKQIITDMESEIQQTGGAA